MARGIREDDEETDVPIEGVLVEPYSTQKAWRFQGDFWDDAEWIPKSNAKFTPDPDSEEHRGTMYVREWLAKKNGWNK